MASNLLQSAYDLFVNLFCDLCFTVDALSGFWSSGYPGCPGKYYCFSLFTLEYVFAPKSLAFKNASLNYEYKSEIESISAPYMY